MWPGLRSSLARAVSSALGQLALGKVRRTGFVVRVRIEPGRKPSPIEKLIS
jgi:hypothetical protein